MSKHSELDRIVRIARRKYGGPGENGEEFNTACFKQAVRESLELSETPAHVDKAIKKAGYQPMSGGCHWKKA